MQFKATFKSMTFNMKAYKKVAFNELLSLNERAGRAWLNAAIKETPIPSWSGASRSTFQKLAQELGTSVPVSIAGNAPNRVGLGRAAGAGSGVKKDKGKVIVGIIYKSTLRYLHYNEYNRAVAGPPPQPWSNNVKFTPYFFQQRAETAWWKVAKSAKLPDPTRYIKTKAL